MPVKRPATIEDAREFEEAGKLYISMDEVERRIAAVHGGEFVHVTSEIADPGVDHVALYFDNERVGYWPDWDYGNDSEEAG